MPENGRHSGEEGTILITTTEADPGHSPPIAAVVTEFCVTQFDYTEMRKGVSSTTSCDFNPEDKITYEDEDEVSRRIDGSFTCFTVDSVDEQALLKAKSFGPTTLVDFKDSDGDPSHGVYCPRIRIKSIKKNHPHGGLQSYNVEFHCKGKYTYDVGGP